MECLEQLNWDSQQGRDLATSGCNKQTFQLGQSHSYIMRKVWNHQIWIQNKLGFMVVHTRQNWYNIHLSVYITWYIQLCCPHDIATRESLISIRNIWVLHAALTKNLLCWSQFTFTYVNLRLVTSYSSQVGFQEFWSMFTLIICNQDPN